jgi:hypothetical protein
MTSPVHAGFEGMIWVVIVVIAVVSEWVKAANRDRKRPLASGKPDEGAWGLPGPRDARPLDQRIEDFLKQHGQPATPQGTAPSPARQPPPPRRTQPTVIAAPKPPVPKRAPAPVPQPAAPPRPAPRMPAAPPPLVMRPPVAAPASMASALREALRADLLEAASLRQAVLLAEIIGPPRALRPLR